MARTITIGTNASEIARQFGDMAREQIPFATALALTALAFSGRKASQAEMRGALELRNRYSASGIQVNEARKSHWPSMQAEVGIEQGRSYLIDHVTGGKREGGTRGRAILEQESLRSSSGRVAKGKRPAALVAAAKRARRKADLNQAFGRKQAKDKRRPFLFHSRKWGNEVLAKRTSDKRHPLEIIYAFRRGVSIRREFEMDRAVWRIVSAEYERKFNRALRRAIATGKTADERRASRSRGQAIGRGR